MDAIKSAFVRHFWVLPVFGGLGCLFGGLLTQGFWPGVIGGAIGAVVATLGQAIKTSYLPPPKQG